MSETDRFNSDEEVEWAQGCFEEGGIAWCRDEPITNNPHESGTFAWKSWNAGWADTDMGWRAEQVAPRSDADLDLGAVDISDSIYNPYTSEQLGG